VSAAALANRNDTRKPLAGSSINQALSAVISDTATPAMLSTATCS
jgi:hypothetical protein